MTKLVVILCVLVACVAGDALAKGRRESTLWFFKEFTCMIFRGNDVWRQRYGVQRVSDNVRLLTVGSSSSGTFTPYHSIDYILTLQFRCEYDALGRSDDRRRLRAVLAALANDNWTLGVEVRDRDGKRVTSFAVAGKDMYNLEEDSFGNCCGYIELELGRIDVPRELVGQPLSVEVRCVSPAGDDLVKFMDGRRFPVDVCCILPFSPM